MVRYEAALETLRRRGHRLTPQRVLVLSVVAEHPGHIGVDEIHRRVRATYPYMDATTVYRTLQLLKRLHLVTEIDGGGASLYELTVEEGHHHMVCRECRRTFDMSPTYLEEFRRTLIQDFGFEPELEHFAIGGRCAECAGRTREQATQRTGDG